MGKDFLLRLSLIGLVFIIRPLAGRGNDGKPSPHFYVNREMMTRSVMDTLPDNKKIAPENAETKPAELLIKEVPKSRKQVKPIAVPITGIKPVQVIKPKIIKPIIKIN